MPENEGIRYRETVRALVDVFDRLGTRGIFIGGLAVSLLAEPRFTKDVDAMVMADSGELEPWLKAAADAGFKPLFDNPVPFAIQNHLLVLRHVTSNVTVDLSLGCTPFEAEIIGRATEYSLGDFSISLPSPEDLVILKAIASRDQDLLDIKRIAEAYPRLDVDRIRCVLEEQREVLYDAKPWEQIEPLLYPK